MNQLFSIGHSDHSAIRFTALLHAHGITAVADVRSQPYSNRTPHFNRETLDHTLRANGIKYVFLGKELGARRDEPECYVEGQARYDRIAGLAAFCEGTRRIRQGLERHRIALMCSEHDPITCHRMILVCHSLRRDVPEIRHISRGGSVESNSQAETRLLRLVGLSDSGLQVPHLLEQAYRRQAERIAFSGDSNPVTKSMTPEADLRLL